VPEATELVIVRTAEGTLKATLRIDDAAREKVSSAVVRAGLGLCAMHAPSTGLEAIFLDLSGAQSAAAQHKALGQDSISSSPTGSPFA
jgi:hypothetical protein